MELRITRREEKLHTIVFKRSDNTETWQVSDDFFVRHDLSHFAVEKILGYKTAFLGMINQGMGANDFEDREKRKKLQITAEGWYAENMANLFLIEIAQGEWEDFNAVSQAAFGKMELPLTPPLLTSQEIINIRTYLRQLLNQWDLLPINETMFLNIDV